jgi:hypothetical protein
MITKSPDGDPESWAMPNSSYIKLDLNPKVKVEL